MDKIRTHSINVCLTGVCVDEKNDVLVVERGQNETQKILMCDAKVRILEGEKNTIYSISIFGTCTVVFFGVVVTFCVRIQQN